MTAMAASDRIFLQDLLLCNWFNWFAQDLSGFLVSVVAGSRCRWLNHFCKHYSCDEILLLKQESGAGLPKYSQILDYSDVLQGMYSIAQFTWDARGFAPLESFWKVCAVINNWFAISFHVCGSVIYFYHYHISLFRERLMSTFLMISDSFRLRGLWQLPCHSWIVMTQGNF